MMRLYSLFFLFTFSTLLWSQDLVFQGRVDLGRDLASFQASPPVKGTLYLLTGAAATIRIVSEDPFAAVVDFVQGEWKDEADLVSFRTSLRFEGPRWAKTVVDKKPRQGSDGLIYPYRKFQVAALAEGDGFKVISITYLF
jgi:hypothetical protein